jgi:ABC-type xylose transport system permease subunit
MADLNHSMAATQGTILISTLTFLWIITIHPRFYRYSIVLAALLPFAYMFQWHSTGRTEPLFLWGAGLMVCIVASFIFFVWRDLRKKSTAIPKLPITSWLIVSVDAVLLVAGLIYFLNTNNLIPGFLVYFLVLNIVSMPLLLITSRPKP